MRKRNRREFLQDSMLAAAAAAAPSSVLFAEEEKQSKSPNERLAVAVVGVNGRGGSHISAFAGRRGEKITYICDVDQKKGPQRCEEIGKRQDGRVPTFEVNLRKVLDDKSVDVISIATPNHWHSLHAIWSIQAGKDVYVEKPVSHNVSEGRRVVEAARKYGKICQTGTQSRSNPGMIEAIKYVQDGMIGKVLVARGLCYKPRPSIGPKGDYPVPANINYDLWLGPAPMAPLTRKQFHYDWHWQWPYGNGDLGNQGIHQMDLARWGLGVKTLCKSVTSYGGRLGYIDAGETANTQVIMHDFGEKSLVFEVRGLKTERYKGASVGVIFEGSDGYVVMSSYHSGAAFDKDGKKIKEFSGDAEDKGHFANFIKAVRSRNFLDLNADIEEGHLSSALCHLGNISYRLGKEVPANDVLKSLSLVDTNDKVADTLERTLAHLMDNEIDLAATKIQVGPTLAFDAMSETFIGNPETNKMLTREYRKPYVVPEAGQVWGVDPSDFQILYEQGPCLVVNKPGGLLTQAPPEIDSLEVRIKRFLKARQDKPGKVYLGVPHRLDRPVSGAMVFATHVKAARRLSEQFEGRLVRKTYWALVAGIVEPAEATWTDYVCKVEGEPRSIVVDRQHPEGRIAILHYRVVGRHANGSCLQIELETGRTHQIRLQAASRGFPLLGDDLYGSRVPFGPVTLDERQRWIALHARSLAFRHPTLSEDVFIEAPLPTWWQDVLEFRI